MFKYRIKLNIKIQPDRNYSTFDFCFFIEKKNSKYIINDFYRGLDVHKEYNHYLNIL